MNISGGFRHPFSSLLSDFARLALRDVLHDALLAFLGFRLPDLLGKSKGPGSIFRAGRKKGNAPLLVLAKKARPLFLQDNQSQRILTSPSTCLNSLSPVTRSDLRSFASAAAKQSA